MYEKELSILDGPSDILHMGKNMEKGATKYVDSP
jgi:hypothetical protein